MELRSTSSAFSFLSSANSVQRSRQTAGSLKKTLSSLDDDPKRRKSAVVAIYDSDCLVSGVDIDIILKDCDFGEDIYSISGGGDDAIGSCIFDQEIRSVCRFEKLESDIRVYDN